MKLNLLTCKTQRPDRRAITQCMVEFSLNVDLSSANEITDLLLDGDPVVIEIKDKDSGSALRALRKLSIDYEIID